ncbi:MAG: aldehyde dehydrogenase family protein, partial [Phycisphaeraceae bacterium]
MHHRPIYLNGKWTNGDGELPVTDPGNGETIATVATVGRDAARRAIDDAHAALPGWRATTARDRGDVLLAAAEALTARTDELATTLTRENGKPIAESRKEVAVAVDHLRWFAEEGRRAYGRIVPPQAEGKRHLVLRQPIGVVAAISPWNFPLMLSARKVAPALAAGCPVILKPAERTPLCTLALAECFEQAGLPAGVFQLLVGDPAEIAGTFFEHPDCRKVSFTGSTAVGRKLIQQSAEQVTKLSLELGGQAPLLVFDDADLDVAVDAAMGSKFRNTGQSCIASNRFYVQAGIHDEFVQRFTEKTAALKVGYGLDEDTDIGAM